MEKLATLIGRALEPQTPWQASWSKVDMLAEAADLMNCLMLLEPRFEYEAGDTTSKLMASMIAWVWRAPQYNYLGLDFDKGL